MTEDFSIDVTQPSRPGDAEEEAAKVFLERLFDERRDQVFFSRQLEVQHEDRWFHWITNRALRDLVASGVIHREDRELANSSKLTLMWHRRNRYYKRAGQALVSLVDEYASPNMGAALGLQGEALVLDGFARRQFLCHGRSTSRFGERQWTDTEHDLDFIFERDGISYGVEVKNALGYMGHDELEVKTRMCLELGLRPVFAVRMLPKTWINEVNGAGGFALILKFQLYPWSHRELARRVRGELGLPVDAPRALEEGTMDRFVNWHEHQT